MEHLKLDNTIRNRATQFAGNHYIGHIPSRLDGDTLTPDPRCMEDSLKAVPDFVLLIKFHRLTQTRRQR